MYALLAGFVDLMIFIPFSLYFYGLERYAEAGICSSFCGIGAVLILGALWKFIFEILMR